MSDDQMVDKYINVECLEHDLDAVGPVLTEEQFVARRNILSDFIFPLIEVLYPPGTDHEALSCEYAARRNEQLSLAQQLEKD